MLQCFLLSPKPLQSKALNDTETNRSTFSGGGAVQDAEQQLEQNWFKSRHGVAVPPQNHVLCESE